jgi:putative NADPH-quinone reductase
VRVLVVHAHPVETSYSHALHAAAVEALRSAGHELELVDLYAEGFDPVLRRDERLHYHDTATNQRPVQRYVDLLKWAEAVVFVFPVWTFGLPAILKGWFDRVLMPGVAFHIDGAGNVSMGLTHIRKVAAVTTYGRPWWLVRFGVGDLPRRVVTRYFRVLCGARTRVRYLAHYHMNKSTPASRAAFLAKVRREMAAF